MRVYSASAFFLLTDYVITEILLGEDVQMNFGCGLCKQPTFPLFLKCLTPNLDISGDFQG